MKAIIMAAGIGSRLRPYTENMPKCLVEVANNTTILDTQLRALKNIGIDEVIIVVGHYAEKIISYVKENYRGMNINFVNNKDYNSTNNMYSFNLTKNYLNGEEFISLNADVMIQEDILKYIQQNNENKNMILCDKSEFMEESMKIVLNTKSNRIINISKAVSKEESYATSIDIYYFNQKASVNLFNIVNDILKERPNDWFEVALAELMKVEVFIPCDIENKDWVEIDNLDDLNLARSICIDGKYSK